MNIINSQAKINCPFCKIIEDKSDCVIIQENEDILVIMDLYPATHGHVLILPRKHIETIYEMPSGLGARIMATAIVMAKAIKYKLSPEGLNLIQANEKIAGQTIPHFHLHLVPRYSGDPVHLQFGHGNVPEGVDELRRIASLLQGEIQRGG